MARPETEEARRRREAADAILHQWYVDNGLDVCVEKNGGKDRDYLRWRVQKLGLTLTAEALRKIRVISAKKKAETHKRNGTVSGRKGRPEVRPIKKDGVRVPDKLTDLEALALGLRKQA